MADFDFGATSAAASGTRVFGTTYPAGAAAEVAVNSAAYSAERFPVPGVGGIVPAGNQKLAVIHARVKNGGSTELSLGADLMAVNLIDQAGTVSAGDDQLYDETSHAALNGAIKPGAEARVICLVKLPAASIGKTLVLYDTGNDFNLTYDLRDSKNAVGKLVAPLVDPKDSTGAVALQNIAGKKGTAYPLGGYDVTFTGLVQVAKFGDGPAWVASFHVKNRLLTGANLYGDTFLIHLSVGGAELDAGWICPANSTRVLSTTVAPGGEMDICAPFMTEIKTAPKGLKIQEGDSRLYTYATPSS